MHKDETVTNSRKSHFHHVRGVLENDMDTTLAYTTAIQETKSNFLVYHVKGHQDDDADENELDPIARMNVHMDMLVGDYIDNVISLHQAPLQPTVFPHQQLLLKVNGTTTVIYIPDLLLSSFYAESTKRHYNNVVKLAHEFHDDIVWDCLRPTLRKNERKSQFIKALHNQWNTTATYLRWKTSKSDTCPICSNLIETWQHVLECDDINMTRMRNELLTNIRNTLRRLKTNEMLEHHIMYILKAWSRGEQIYAPETSPYFPSEAICLAHLHQHEIGFDLFVKGIICTK